MTSYSAKGLNTGHLWTPVTNPRPRPDIIVRADTPPTFLLHAEDDHVDDVKDIECSRTNVYGSTGGECSSADSG
jgi:hypothetical protein